MNSVQIGQKSYEMPPREGISIAHFLTVADIERSARLMPIAFQNCHEISDCFGFQFAGFNPDASSIMS